jgi:carbamate kinase
MLPKVKAAMAFAQSKPGRKSLITSLEKAAEGIAGKTGTVIVAN